MSIFFLLATFVLFTLSLNKSRDFASTCRLRDGEPRDPAGTATITVTQEEPSPGTRTGDTRRVPQRLKTFHIEHPTTPGS